MTGRALSILSTYKVMNTPNSRWVREAAGSVGPTNEEQVVFAEVLAAMRRVRHGAIQLSIQDGRVVQIETTEKKRL